VGDIVLLPDALMPPARNGQRPDDNQTHQGHETAGACACGVAQLMARRHHEHALHMHSRQVESEANNATYVLSGVGKWYATRF
jgi:hypothetical protein